MPSRPAAIIFDFGGVVVDWDPRRVYRRFLESDEAIDRFFAEVGFRGWNAEQDRGVRSWDDAVSELAAQFPHHRQLIRAYHELWEESIGGPIEGPVAIVRRLRDAGHRLAGLTNWSAEKFALTRKRYDLFNLFDVIIVSGEERVMKPDRGIFDIALQRLGGVRAEDCLFIDDHPPNVQAATALGFDVIRFESPEQLERELRQRDIL